MREISAKKIVDTIKKLSDLAQYSLSKDVLLSVTGALEKEEAPLAKNILGDILKNAEIAKKDSLPLCQDTGLAVVFVEIGQEVHIIDGNLTDAINEGIKSAYQNLRKSIVSDPLERINTEDNTPAVIHTEIVPGDKLKIGLLPKGGGAENASVLKMFLPTASKEEIIKFVVDTVKENGINACPPLIIGIGIGGTFDSVAFLAKKALTRKVGSTTGLEKEILERINKLGLGPMGLKGKTTALSVQIEKAPCHIASLPVAINFECHSHRYQEALL